MQQGAITEYIDVAQAAWWLFFLAFLAVVYYLRREDKREGYPLHDPGRPARDGFPAPPPAQVVQRLDGSETVIPHYDPDPPVSATAPGRFGEARAPIGNRLTAALGPGTYTMRRDEPFTTMDGNPQVQPLRTVDNWSVMPGDADPRGMRVLDVRYRPVGLVRDIWVDRGAKLLRYVEVALDEAQGGGVVLAPIYFCDVAEKAREVRIMALRRNQFATAPRLRDPDQITAREEDQVNAYYAGGRFYVEDFSEGYEP